MAEENKEDFLEDFSQDIDSDLDISSNIHNNIHNAVYNIVTELQEYTSDSYLPLLDNLNYIDLFYYIEDIVQT